MKNILVLGSKGQIGLSLTKILQNSNKYNVIECDIVCCESNDLRKKSNFLNQSFRDADLQFEVGLIPGNASLGIRSRTNVGGNANVIFKSTKSPKLAMKFLRYLSSAAVQSVWMEELGAIPINNMFNFSFKSIIIFSLFFLFGLLELLPFQIEILLHNLTFFFQFLL